MVKYIILLALLFSNHIVYAADKDKKKKFTVERLKENFNANDKALKDSAARLKASRTNAGNLKLLTDNDLYFKMPNGNWVKGLLLPNGQIAPLFKEKGEKFPACVTSTMELVKGQWDNVKSVITCELSQHQLAFLEGQISTVSTEEIKPVEVVDIPEVEETRKALPPKDGTKEKPIVTTELAEVEPKKALYRPPTIRSNSFVTSAAVLHSPNNNKFGIPIGTWAKCRLLRPVSSSDGGFMDIVLTEDLKGRYNTIPANTVLFASKRINESTERLEANVQKALTPDEQEIDSITAMLFSVDKSAGLKGEVIRNRVKEAESHLGFSILNNIPSTVGKSTSLLGGTLSDFSDKMIATEEANLTKAPKSTVKVQPQNCLIQILNSF